MRFRCKEEKSKRIKSINASETRKRGLKKFSSTISKVKIMGKFGMKMKEGGRSKRRSVNMDYINSNLLNDLEKKPFQKNGIRDEKFINMIND